MEKRALKRERLAQRLAASRKVRLQEERRISTSTSRLPCPPVVEVPRGFIGELDPQS